MKFFEGCTALITGASSGLGEEFAHQLAPVAGNMVLVARRHERLEVLATALRKAHSQCSVFVYRADLAVEAERKVLVHWLEEKNILVNFLVNNAGLGDHGEFALGEWERVRAMLDVNISALTHLTHLLIPSMVKSGCAAVLNVSSVAGFFPLPQMAVYSATKAYVTSFSEALAMELRPRGVTVTALCPGPIPTEFSAVAARPGSEAKVPHSEDFSLFTVTSAEAVRAGLRAVARGRSRTIPGPLLALAVGVALLVPFFITRKVLSSL